MIIDWKEAARNYRFHMIMADDQERRLKRRLWQEHEQRTALITAPTDVLCHLAPTGYGERCRACHIETAHFDHLESCWYSKALAVVAEAGKSVEG